MYGFIHFRKSLYEPAVCGFTLSR